MTPKMLLNCLLTVICSLLYITCASETPIIGVLSQEAYLVKKQYPDAHSFIAASYVKLLESSGARVLPVWIGQDAAYYTRVVNFTNGILFPGGGTYFNESGGYGEAATALYKAAVALNQDKGVYYPIWGICLGMQVLMFAALDGQKDIRGDCDGTNIALPLNFVDGFEDSRLFAKAPESLIENLKTQNLTYNYHRYCIFEEDLQRENLRQDWRILSKNKDKNNKEFISTMEHVDLPFYGTQYHPEKNNFEFTKKNAIPHSAEAVEMSQYLSNFFVNEARKNNQTFPRVEMELNSLIYNYTPVYSGLTTSYEQLYLFKEEDYAKNLLL